MGVFTNRLSYPVAVATRKEIIANEVRTPFLGEKLPNYIFDGMDGT